MKTGFSFKIIDLDLDVKMIFLRYKLAKFFLHVDTNILIKNAVSIDLKNKVAFITGAAHGQGRATALALAKEGVHIVAFDIAKQLNYPGYNLGTSEDLETLHSEVEKFGVNIITCSGDVRNNADIMNAVSEALTTFGHIDILFNNAGICAYGFSHELTEEEWDTMIDINLKGAWMVGRRIIPYFIQQKSGVIINNSSVAGLRGMNRLSHYSASKWGLTGLTKSWAIELAQYNIRVVSIHPTGVNTPMNDGLAEMEGSTPQEIGQRSAGNLINVPWIEADDVANMVVFLASDKAKFVTGSQFVLDAGLLTK
jgi:SDR family mycofactocin-dependent oxidoreductase